MELQGAAINFLGDSITFGFGTSDESMRFSDVLRREYGLKKANNYGVCGSRIARQRIVTAEDYDRDFCMRMTEMDKDADAVVVFGGTNDYGHGEAPLGVKSDRDPFTFYGACHYLMNGLLECYSGKPVVIMTPLQRLDEDDPRGDRMPLCNDRKPLSVGPLRAYRDILLEVACHYALPVLDLYATSGIRPDNAVSRSQLCPDGLHPNDAGHAIVARRLAQFLKLL